MERDIHDYIPVIIGAIGMGTGVLKKVLETIPGKQSLDSAKKTLLGPSHVITKVLQSDGWFKRGSTRD